MLQKEGPEWNLSEGRDLEHCVLTSTPPDIFCFEAAANWFPRSLMALIPEMPRLPTTPTPLPRPSLSSSRLDCSTLFREKNSVKVGDEKEDGLVHYNQWHCSNLLISSRSQMMNVICVVSSPAASLDTNPGAVHHSASALGSESSTREQEGCRNLREHLSNRHLEALFMFCV